jgi:hypothetical protein
MGALRDLDVDAAALLDRQIDDLLLDVRGLALVREILARRGASSAEIAAHSRALERGRTRLAELIREPGDTAAGLHHAA